MQDASDEGARPQPRWPGHQIGEQRSGKCRRYRAKEQELSQQLRETEQKLTQLPKAADGAGELLSPEQSKAIEGFRAQMLKIRSELRDVQFALRRDVDSLKNWITAINVGVVPVTAAIIVLVFALRRPRRSLVSTG